MSISVQTQAAHVACQPKPRSIWARLGQVFAVRRQRQHLQMLDEHLLNDIGVTRSEALQEGEKMPWDAPAHWHQ
ncbi:DUF1127 domain-containing protein [Loktanella sp. Alg231-35]|uniref:DUF1127 domain-containing protein n=1 Tax=Loktanella sp. Alg231-35 TaxID=1922220 RepID=UPI000D55A7DD|nr:DUF1127 domain-containing protein [Loktanella sp. Alg231-35]